MTNGGASVTSRVTNTAAEMVEHAARGDVDAFAQWHRQNLLPLIEGAGAGFTPTEFPYAPGWASAGTRVVRRTRGLG